MMTAFLSQDAVSKSRRDHIYARAGAPVTIIADHGNVIIVEDENGQRFPAHCSIVSQDPIPEKTQSDNVTDHIVINPSPTKTVITTPRKKKSAATQQQNLF